MHIPMVNERINANLPYSHFLRQHYLHQVIRVSSQHVQRNGTPCSDESEVYLSAKVIKEI